MRTAGAMIPVIVTALATGAMALLWLGRFDEAERWLERAGRALRPGGEPGTELIVDYARALLCLARGSLEEALAALRAATQMEGLLAGEHAFAPVVRARLLQTQARMGELACRTRGARRGQRGGAQRRRDARGRRRHPSRTKASQSMRSTCSRR